MKSKNSLRRAVLVTYADGAVRDEFVGLSVAAEYEPVSVVTQNYIGAGKYGIGEGKAEELKDSVKRLGVSVILIDEPLRTKQVYNLAKLCRVEVKDREKLILEIFNRRASSMEAKLQVQLAELSYEMPRAKDKVRLAKAGEQPGFFGLGEYEVDVLFMAIKRRIPTIRRKLLNTRKTRELHMRQRRREGLPIVSLAGYTGAGKTALFNMLTSESRETSGGVFTTLSTCTRAMGLHGRKVLISDTVGFISRLPAYMIEAFRSTLEELTTADLILFVMDSSQSMQEMERRYRSSREIFAELRVSPSKTLYLLNKIDLSLEEEVLKKANDLGLPMERVVLSSARTGRGREHLIERINLLTESEPVEMVSS